ncbi:glycosyltransferase family 2 protein [Rhodotorula graminis WP1]|uniref:Glycosyltransferase family 2 protein n=1 Tax=Rhodotorula graminis (strain WP1) TaxID=578459 RepID=A0A194SB59_RHOGW|nr:glycosyltransferase family 2 protein [Rhodotorula graminis WP1]KPV77829.1 glycosyltransferase family 2 protein [Rhodotorula graminis WP1]
MRFPRKAARALRYVVIAAAVAALCWSRACSPISLRLDSSTASPRLAPPPVDYAWGSILHRYQNHPRPARARRQLPWPSPADPDSPRAQPRRHQGEPARARAPPRVLIVTSELSGLHKNGGIGTAFRELAHALADADLETSILVAHLADTFPHKKRDALTAELADKRIRLLFVDKEPQPFWPQAWTPVASMRVWRYLRAHDGEWDVVHFPDNTGIGYFSALAKHEGLALVDSRIVVGLHGADVEWAAMLNKRYPVDKYAVELGVFERRTAEWADAVVAPSDYMLEYVRQRGWAVPHDSFVIPNVVQVPALSNGDRSSAVSASGAVGPVTELVFFGRLEERKGTRLLIAALENLYSLDPVPPALAAVRHITFLGRDQQDLKTRSEASWLLAGALDAIKQYTNATFSHQFLSTMDRDEALAYLQNSSRLAVLPSLADNSPSTVLECIAHGVRFISSSIGGIPELIHPADRDQVVFAPLVKAFSAKLRETLERLETAPWTSVRPAPETQTAASDWVAFHHWIVDRPAEVGPSASSLDLVSAADPLEPLVTICVTHYERPHLLPQLLDSLVHQTFAQFEVVLVDDGSTSPETLAALTDLTSRYIANSTLLAGRPSWSFRQIANSYLGEARNVAASSARGRWLLFLDDDDVLKPHALATLLSVAQRTGARALSTWLDEFASDADPLAPRPEGVDLPHRRTYWFLGQELSAGLLSNAYGSGNVFVARETFDRVGGFSTYREVGGEDWEFYTRLALEEGEKHLVVPEELIFARSDPARASMKWTMDPWDAHFHATVPILNDPRIQSLNLAPAVQFLKSIVTREHLVPPFADSRRDFQLSQGWGGWTYSFEPAGPSEELLLSPERHGIVDDSSFIMDREHPRRPFIDDANQLPFVTPEGTGVAAVRTFRSPKAMHVAVEASYRSFHECGDGTRLSLVLVRSRGEVPEVLHEWQTMDDGFAEFAGETSLRVGSTLSLVSDPLESDECDRVEVTLRLTPVSPEKMGWSGLARAAMWKQAEARKAAEHAAVAKRANDSFPLLPDGELHYTPSEPVQQAATTDDKVFNVALIFDRHRLEHVQSVMRSVRHFTTSRDLVFHLVAPPELHHTLEKEFNGAGTTVRTYDHALCGFVVRKVLAFSNPDIHTSAHCKMFLTEIITIAERVLYLDTDVTVVSDLAACYGEPVARPGALVSMGVDMGDVCQRTPDLCWPIGLHMRVPPGLVCGNVPSRAVAGVEPASCAHEGELETVQVNGGVALFELAKMREVGFVERYVQSVVHHYRMMGNVVAKWGEQDFVNSYFRLHPDELELLPCGCNYQWFGARREVMCGAQPVAIAHHWSHGIAARNKEPYNVLFHHFLDAEPDAVVPPVPDLSYSAPGAPNSSSIEIEHSLDCPRQTHSCTTQRVGTEYGQNVIVLSRILTETFAADQVDSLEAQMYPALSQAIAYRAGEVDVPSPSFQRDELALLADPADEYGALCAKCGSLAARGEACSSPPTGAIERRAYFDCVCALPDRNALVVRDLEAFARDDGGWVTYLDDSALFVAPESLSLLMAEVDARDQLVLFRSNTSSREQERTFRHKILPRSPLDGVGFLFHSSHLDLSTWSSDTRCGKWATLTRLATRLRLKWLDLVPTMEHPLQRHLPATPAAEFKLSVIVLETQGRIAWAPTVLDVVQSPELEPLVGEVVVASVDSPEGVYGDDVPVVKPPIGSGMSQLASVVKGERVLILSDSVLLDKPAITALLTFHLDHPTRLLGMFTETDDGPEGGEFSAPLDTSPDTFDSFSEPDALVGVASWHHLRPRVLLTPRSHLDELASLLSSLPADAPPVHPMCHPVLLSALAARASGHAPLRVLPPRRSVVDRVHDCRVRNWADVDYGRTAGDWAVPVEHVEDESDAEGFEGLAGGDEALDDDEDDGDEVELDGAAAADEGEDEEVQSRLRKRDAVLDGEVGAVDGDEGEVDEADFPIPPSLDECHAVVRELLGDDADKWLVSGSQVGVAGPLGVRVGLEDAATIDDERWRAARRSERCLRV